MTGLFVLDQFYGVDMEEDVIRNNQGKYPDAHWFQDEFTCVLEKANPFNPGLVNFDMVCMVDAACLSMAQALHVLVERDVKNVLLAANFMLNNPRENSQTCRSPFYRSSCQGNSIRRALKRGWRVHNETYLYDGADKRSNSFMQTVYFFRKK